MMSNVTDMQYIFVTYSLQSSLERVSLSYDEAVWQRKDCSKESIKECKVNTTQGINSERRRERDAKGKKGMRKKRKGDTKEMDNPKTRTRKDEYTKRRTTFSRKGEGEKALN